MVGIRQHRAAVGMSEPEMCCPLRSHDVISAERRNSVLIIIHGVLGFRVSNLAFVDFNYVCKNKKCYFICVIVSSDHQPRNANILKGLKNWV